MAVSSLFDLALQAVMRDFIRHEPELRYLPSEVKARVAKVMAKRGLLSERNMALVSASLTLSNAPITLNCITLCHHSYTTAHVLILKLGIGYVIDIDNYHSKID